MEKKGREGLTVVVTGASSGFGKGLVQQLIAEGANVVFGARRTPVIEAMAEELGERAIGLTVDVGNAADHEKLLEAALNGFGSIDVWVNNAGLGVIGSFTETPIEDSIRTLEVNLLGTMQGSHTALRQFKKQGRGTLINMSSFADGAPLPFGSAYSASKYGIRGFSSALYREMELSDEQDIHVCFISPWVTDTPWTMHAGNYTGHEIALGEADDPQDVIEAMLGLIDEPEESKIVGAGSKAAILAHRALPGAEEKLNGKLLMKMMQQAPHTPHTSGSLHVPRPEGTTVYGKLNGRKGGDER